MTYYNKFYSNQTKISGRQRYVDASELGSVHRGSYIQKKKKRKKEKVDDRNYILCSLVRKVVL